jgi:folate-binding protein YgfZ
MSLDLGFVWADRSDRERLVISGPDRAKFLHNLCTNDVKRLTVGSGCEAFVTSPQGRTLGLITILAREDSLLILADPGGLEFVLPHFEKYGVFDDVSFRDERETTYEIHVAGELSPAWLTLLGAPSPGDREFDHVSASWSEKFEAVVRESPLGMPGFTLIGPAENRPFLLTGLDRGPLAEAALEGLRVEAGTPRFGRDFTVENLPQEVGRDSRAISFVKGCYLGQETVARLDALGHVNKILRGLEVRTGQVPEPGVQLAVDGLPAGVVTSSGRSPRDDRGVALAMVRVKTAPVGAIVAWEGGEGQVVDRQTG